MDDQRAEPILSTRNDANRHPVTSLDALNKSAAPTDQGRKLIVIMVRTVRRSSTVASTVEGSYW